MGFRALFLVVASMLLGGCISEDTVTSLADTLASPEIRAEAERVGDMALAHDTEGVKAAFVPQVVTPDFDAQLEKLWSLVPMGEVTSRTLGTLKVTKNQNGTFYQYQYQYGVAGQWILMDIILQKGADQPRLYNLHVTQLDGDLMLLHQMDLLAAAPLQWLFLILLVSIPVFCIATLVAVVRMRRSLARPKRWMLFVILGFGGLKLNWTTGALFYQLLSVGLLGASFTKGGLFMPWILSINLPLGAILFWFFKKTGRLKLKPVEPETIAAEPAPAA